MDKFFITAIVLLLLFWAIMVAIIPLNIYNSYKVKQPICEEEGISNWRCFWADSESLNYRMQKRVEVEVK